jgi:alkylation response protein AidB-like acyl-CoA dehydrogenase
MARVTRAFGTSPEPWLWLHVVGDLSDARRTRTPLGLSREAAQLVSGPHALDDARWPQAFLWWRVGAIAGGTSEVQANSLAPRMLGLPR